MANKYTKTPAPAKKELTKLYRSGMTQSQLGKHYGVSQKVVWRWMKESNIKQRVPCNRDQQGEKNKYWKGDKATYKALHIRVQKLRGKPRKCEECGTTKAKRYEWASKTKNYKDPSDYIRLCKKCHLEMDTIRSDRGWVIKKP